MGAGASVDSRAKTGNPPLGGQLAADIAAHFGMTDNPPLPALANRINRDPAKSVQLFDYLRARYSGCRAAPYYADLVTMRWSAIWTFNVDDVVEDAYKRFRSAQRGESFHFEDEPAYPSNTVPIIHLHGRVTEERPEKIIFSTLEYLKYVGASPRWYGDFGTAWRESPFIVVGAALVDEYDMQSFLDLYGVGGKPSIYVSPNVSVESEEDLNGLGFEVVRSTAGEFFSALLRDVQQWQRGIDDPQLRDLLDPLLKDFSTVPQLATEPAPERHSLLRGSRPLLSDIRAGSHIPLDWHQELIADIEKKVNAGESGVILVEGQALDGKSVGLWAAASELEKRGHLVLVHNGVDFRNAAEVRRRLASIPSVVIITDAITRFGRIFAELIDRSDNSIVVVGAARTERLQFATTLLSRTSFALDDTVASAMGSEDARHIDSTLDQRAHLNRIQDWAKKDRVNMFLAEGIFGGLYRTNHDHRFVERLANELPDDDRRFKALVAVGCLLDGYELGLPAGHLRELGFDHHTVLDTLFERTGDVWRLTYAPVLESAVRLKLDTGAMRDLIEEYLVIVAGGTSSATIRSGRLTPEIAKALVRFLPLRNWIGKTAAAELLEWAGQFLDWDGGYWEQRSKAARGLNQYEDAERFAAKAAGELPDTRRFATLGKQRVWRAAKDPSFGIGDRLELFNIGLEDFQRSTSLSATNPVPIWEALRSLADFAEQHYSMLQTNDLVNLQARWNYWWTQSGSGDITVLSRFNQDVRDFDAKFRRALALDEVGEAPSTGRETVTHQGTVEMYNPTKGFGFIKPESIDSEDLFFHISDCVVDVDELYRGERVFFQIGAGKRGPKAARVTLA